MHSSVYSLIAYINAFLGIKSWIKLLYDTNHNRSLTNSSCYDSFQRLARSPTSFSLFLFPSLSHSLFYLSLPFSSCSTRLVLYSFSVSCNPPLTLSLLFFIYSLSVSFSLLFFFFFLFLMFFFFISYI